MKKNRTKRYQVVTFLLKCIGMTPFLLFAFAVSAEIHGNMPGGEPSLTFEDHGLEYFVMFNSFLDDTITFYGETSANPQGDVCLSTSSFTLTEKHLPNDAIVEKAYLIWMGAVAPDQLDKPTDNEVTLSFYNKHTKKVKAGDVGKLLTDAPSFEFEGIKFVDDVEIGCSNTFDGSTVQAEVGYFTYRVEVTDFMKTVQESALEGDSIYGRYTLSDLECTDHDNYKCRTTMVSAWALIVLYRSNQIVTIGERRKLYLYTGLSYAQGEVVDVEISGFSLPKNPIIRQTLMVTEGDSALEDNPALPRERLSITGEDVTDPYPLYNKCNPKTGLDYEIYNSNSSIVNWNPNAYEEDLISCVTGGEDGHNYGVDVDTFLLNAEKDIYLTEHLVKGTEKIMLTLSVNQDAIVTNFLMLSVDSQTSRWDIPAESKNMPWQDDREKQWCACPLGSERDREYYCYYERPFYYMIKVENWGGDIAKDVKIIDELIDMNYVPGSAEVATKYSVEKGYYIDWKSIPDKSGETPAEKFPLSGDGYKVADEMAPCDIYSLRCEDSRLIRFLVKPKEHLSYIAVLKNTALISSATGEIYKTNNAWPIPLMGQDCVSVEECPQPRKEDCGGIFVEQTDDENSDSDSVDDSDDIADTDDDIATPDDNNVTHTKDSSACSVVVIP